MGLWDGLGYALDTPRALSHGVMAKIGDAVSGRKVRDNWRGSGRDMLESLGIVGKDEDGLDAGDAAGYAAELFLDPLNILGAGVAAKVLAGKRLGKIAGATKLADAANVAGDIAPIQKAVAEVPRHVDAPMISTLMGEASSPLPNIIPVDPVRKLRAAVKTAKPAAAVPSPAVVVPEVKNILKHTGRFEDDFENAFHAAASGADRTSSLGTGNSALVSMEDIRRLLPGYSREQIDKGIRKLREMQKYAMEPGHGKRTASMNDAGIKEGSDNLIWISRLLGDQ